MAHPVILEEECIGCGICVDDCPKKYLKLSMVLLPLLTKSPASLVATVLKAARWALSLRLLKTKVTFWYATFQARNKMRRRNDSVLVCQAVRLT